MLRKKPGFKRISKENHCGHACARDNAEPGRADPGFCRGDRRGEQRDLRDTLLH